MLLLLFAALTAHAVRAPQPAIRLDLTDLGFPGIPQSFQNAGAAMLTVHFVDTTHLLVTYSLRGLVERIPDDPPEDEDRAVGALLVELPTGKVLARARWHLHDYSQYLWPLGNGRFLLRIKSTLTTIAPLANLDSKDPFRQTTFVQIPGVINAILISPEGNLATIEASTPHKHPADPSGGMVVGDTAPPAESHPPENFYFVRISGTGSADSPVRAISAGSVQTSGVGVLPVNDRGYLFAKSNHRNGWAMLFDGYDGQTRELSKVDSSCTPLMQFVSPSQFVVFTCRGSDNSIMLSAFDFKPQEIWEEPLGGTTYGHFAFAQQAGRFAFSRTISMLSPTAAANLSISNPTPETVAGQEVRIYQVESGDLLLKLNCSPVSNNGQNFDLTPDGLNALVVRDGYIEIYRLPPPTETDKKELAEVQSYEPPPSTSTRVELRRILREAAEVAVESTPAPSEQDAAQPPKPTNTAMTATAGDVEKPRKRPTLLKPGESAEYGPKKPE